MLVVCIIIKSAYYIYLRWRGGFFPVLRIRAASVFRMGELGIAGQIVVKKESLSRAEAVVSAGKRPFRLRQDHRPFLAS